MKDYLVKFKYIFPVYVLIYLVTVFGLYALRYFLSIKFQIIAIDEKIWELWIPLTLPGILLLIFMRPRMKILTFGNSEDRSSFIVIVGWFFIIATTINSQQVLKNTTGSLSKVTSYEAIQGDSIRFVHFTKPFYLNRNQLGFSADVSVSGKHNEELNFDFYFVLPFVKSKRSNVEEVSNVWFCKKFHKKISNRNSNSEKNQIYNGFYMQCIKDLDLISFNEIEYFERIPKSSDLKYGLLAINDVIPETIYKKKKELPILLQPVTSDFDKRAGNLLPWFFGFLISGLLTIPLLLLWPSYNKKRHENILKGKKDKDDDFFEFFHLFVPKGDHFMISILLNVMVLLYLIQLIQYNSGFMSRSELLLDWGAVRYQEVSDGEFWRLFTSIFSHGGFFHLVYNGIALVFVGIHIEPILGRIKFFIYFILSGIAASLASIIWNDNVISVGASGAIFGLFGLVIFIDYFKTKSFSTNKYIIILFAIFAGINFIYGLMVPNTDNAGHFGGFVAGIVLAYLNAILDREEEFTTNRK